ncbi:transcription elongation factor GreA [Streptomyces chrestomyceticus]|uniref:transcription elongation factor GreA n=1 Tax=Streptomyces chrestomyceticus TaxID=68185 RepID=UPI0033FED2F8
MDRVPMTPRGAELLRDELRRLKEADLPIVVKEIGLARGHGTENAEYLAARERKDMIMSQIERTEAALAQGEIIDVTKVPNTGKVVFGATVTLKDTADDATVNYRIVGAHEASPRHGLISYAWPPALALLGKQRGDVVSVDMPSGRHTYEIIAVDHL